MVGFVKRFLRKRKYGEPIIIVSGLPRSGTSMMMRMLEAGEMEIVSDGEREADNDNPNGYYELERVKDLDKTRDDEKEWLGESRGKVIKIISLLLQHLPDRFAYKIIFMRRNLDEILSSQNKMLVHRDEAGSDADDEEMGKLYRTHLRTINSLMDRRPNFDHLDVAYKDALNKPEAHARRLTEFLGREMDIEKMASVVDPQLYRNRS